jgi:hypothetical protein
MRSRTESAPSRTQPNQVRDRRGFWRILLAVILPIPFLAKGTDYLLNPVAGDSTFKESVAWFEAHQGLLDTLEWLNAAFVVLLIPATMGVVWVARRGAPRLTTWAAFITLSGFFTGIAVLPAGYLGMETVQHDLDFTAMAALDDAMQHEPMLGIASLLFIVGVVFGLGLLGGALKRSGAVPTWVAFAVMLGGATHPFIPTTIGQGIGLYVLAAGFAGVSAALLRMSNDEFDLPATAA